MFDSCVAVVDLFLIFFFKRRFTHSATYMKLDIRRSPSNTTRKRYYCMICTSLMFILVYDSQNPYLVASFLR